MSNDLRRARLTELISSGNIFASLSFERISKQLKNHEEAQKFSKISKENSVLATLRVLADKDAYAQALMGNVFQYGLAGTSINKDIALKLYNRSAMQENRYAQRQLAMMYNNEKSIRYYEKSWKWAVEAEKQNCHIARYICGILLFYGLSIPKDENKAMIMITTSALQGYIEAQYSLGRLLFVTEPEFSFEWMRKAAAQGYSEAQYDLAWMYATGHGVDKDERISMEWYKKAADQGHKNAKQALTGRKFLVNPNYLSPAPMQTIEENIIESTI